MISPKNLKVQGSDIFRKTKAINSAKERSIT